MLTLTLNPLTQNTPNIVVRLAKVYEPVEARCPDAAADWEAECDSARLATGRRCLGEAHLGQVFVRYVVI